MLKEDTSPSKVHMVNKGRQKQNRWRPPQEIHNVLTQLDFHCSAAGKEIPSQDASAHTVQAVHCQSSYQYPLIREKAIK